MLKNILKQPVGIAGILILAFGMILGFNYDPSSYEKKDPYRIADPYQAGKIMAENAQKEQEQQTEVAMIWGSIGFGLLMLGNALWKASRPKEETDESSPDPTVPGVTE